MNHFKILLALMASFCICICTALTASAAESDSTKHYYTVYEGSTKSEYYIEGEEVVALINYGSNSPDYSPHWYETKGDSTYIHFYRLNASKTGVELVNPRRVKTYTLTDGEWVCTWDSTETGTEIAVSSSAEYKNWYYDFSDSGIDIIRCNMTDRIKDHIKGTGEFEYKETKHSIESNLYSYMTGGVFTDYGTNYSLTSHESLAEIVPTTYNYSVKLSATLSVTYDEENGEISWNEFFTRSDATVFKGVIAKLHYQGDSLNGFADYVAPLTGLGYKLSFGGTDFKGDENCRYDSITLIPYWITTSGNVYLGNSTRVSIDADSTAATRTGDKLFTATIRKSNKSDGILPSKGDPVYGLSDYMTEGFDLTDLTYNGGLYLRGFSADYSIHAKWSELVTPTEIQEQIEHGFIEIVEKGIRARLVYAYHDAPEQIAYTKYIDKIYDADKGSCYIPYSVYKPEEDSVFLRDVEIIPVVIMKPKIGIKGNIWGYYGQTAYVRFNNDETENEIKKDVGDIVNSEHYSSDTETSLGDMDISLGWFQETLSSLINGIGQLPSFFATMFGFLPSPVVAVLGIVVVLCVILRILGR